MSTPHTHNPEDTMNVATVARCLTCRNEIDLSITDTEDCLEGTVAHPGHTFPTAADRRRAAKIEAEYAELYRTTGDPAYLPPAESDAPRSVFVFTYAEVKHLAATGELPARMAEAAVAAELAR